MKKHVQNELDILLTNYPQLSVCADDIRAAFEILKETCLQGGLIMTCGNGGSAADAGHIVGELMKGFKLKRQITDTQRKALLSAFPVEGAYLADTLQRGIPAISLASQSALFSAYVNDIVPDMVFAQQVFGYGSVGDVLLGISTSGNSQNVVNACKVAKAFGIGTIGLTGEYGGELRSVCDVTICVPACETFRVQEYHLPVYHALCAMIESELFL
jgi:phosphoheptose isomerase